MSNNFHKRKEIPPDKITESKNGMNPFIAPLMVILFNEIPKKSNSKNNTVAMIQKGKTIENENVKTTIKGKLTKTKSSSEFKFSKSEFAKYGKVVIK